MLNHFAESLSEAKTLGISGYDSANDGHSIKHEDLADGEWCVLEIGCNGVEDLNGSVCKWNRRVSGSVLVVVVWLLGGG